MTELPSAPCGRLHGVGGGCMGCGGATPAGEALRVPRRFPLPLPARSTALGDGNGNHLEILARQTIRKRAHAQNLIKAMFKIRPDQLKALRAEATRRMVERSAGRIDASEVLREAVDKALKLKAPS